MSNTHPTHRPLHPAPVTKDKGDTPSKAETAKAEKQSVHEEPKPISPTDQLLDALQAFMNAGTGKISPGNAVWNQAQSAITNASKKP